VKTIQRLRAANRLDPRQRVKVARREVRQIIVRSVLRYPWPAAWQRMVAAPALISEQAVIRRA
jgi:hypothetical protein